MIDLLKATIGAERLRVITEVGTHSLQDVLVDLNGRPWAVTIRDLTTSPQPTRPYVISWDLVLEVVAG